MHGLQLNKSVEERRSRLDWQIFIVECCWCEDEPLEVAIAESNLPRKVVAEIYSLKDEQQERIKWRLGTK